MTTSCSTKNAGFTLVELLVVISIISILAGAIYMLVNPANMRRKAKEASLKSTVTKVCTSLFACASVKSAATDCAGYANLGIATAPADPAGATFTAPAAAGTVVSFSGSYVTGSNTCTYQCSFDFSDGAVVNVPSTSPAGCL